jgi:hypothetical protein
MGNHLYQLVLFISSCGNTIFNSFTSILSERVISEKKISHVKKKEIVIYLIAMMNIILFVSNYSQVSLPIQIIPLIPLFSEFISILLNKKKFQR